VLDEVRRFGVEIRGLTAEEGRLDALYRELVAEAGSGHEDANCRPRHPAGLRT
jgi:hypothetical protein